MKTTGHKKPQYDVRLTLKEFQKYQELLKKDDLDRLVQEINEDECKRAKSPKKERRKRHMEHSRKIHKPASVDTLFKTSSSDITFGNVKLENGLPVICMDQAKTKKGSECREVSSASDLDIPVERPRCYSDSVRNRRKVYSSPLKKERSLPELSMCKSPIKLADNTKIHETPELQGSVELQQMPALKPAELQHPVTACKQTDELNKNDLQSKKLFGGLSSSIESIKSLAIYDNERNSSQENINILKVMPHAAERDHIKTHGTRPCKDLRKTDVTAQKNIKRYLKGLPKISEVFPEYHKKKQKKFSHVRPRYHMPRQRAFSPGPSPDGEYTSVPSLEVCLNTDGHYPVVNETKSRKRQRGRINSHTESSRRLGSQSTPQSSHEANRCGSRAESLASVSGKKSSIYKYHYHFQDTSSPGQSVMVPLRLNISCYEVPPVRHVDGILDERGKPLLPLSRKHITQGMQYNRASKSLTPPRPPTPTRGLRKFSSLSLPNMARRDSIESFVSSWRRKSVQGNAITLRRNSSSMESLSGIRPNSNQTDAIAKQRSSIQLDGGLQLKQRIPSGSIGGLLSKKTSGPEPSTIKRRNSIQVDTSSGIKTLSSLRRRSSVAHDMFKIALNSNISNSRPGYESESSEEEPNDVFLDASDTDAAGGTSQQGARSTRRPNRKTNSLGTLWEAGQGD